MDKALSIAQGMETADHDMKAMKTTTSTSTVLNIPARTPSALVPNSPATGVVEITTVKRIIKRRNATSVASQATLLRYAGAEKTNSQPGQNRRRIQAKTKWVAEKTPTDSNDELALFTVGSASQFMRKSVLTGNLYR